MAFNEFPERTRSDAFLVKVYDANKLLLNVECLVFREWADIAFFLRSERTFRETGDNSSGSVYESRAREQA